MPTPRAIQRRIKSVRNISQVTRAMEMVAAAKMRRAQAATLASRAYAEKAWQVLTYVASQPGTGRLMHPLLEVRPHITSTVLVLITSDRGLCGAYNVNIIRKALDYVHKLEKPVRLITIGRRGRDLAARYGLNIIAEFTGMSERPSVADIGPVSKIAIEEFVSGRADQVHIAYTEFVNVLVQRPMIRELLPIRPALQKRTGAEAVYLYEPNPEAILSSVLPRFTELQLYQSLLESVASEYSARMVAMRNATDNAHDLILDLTLAMNKARQASITKEMLDIAGGAEAQRQAQSASGQAVG
ncbi:MAG: ATP synthase F1 subunit gamma [Chloroflexi bacterium]|nr:ATP synthase F1 subunit gamma [Chloroflexota bacterium]